MQDPWWHLVIQGLVEVGKNRLSRVWGRGGGSFRKVREIGHSCLIDAVKLVGVPRVVFIGFQGGERTRFEES